MYGHSGLQAYPCVWKTGNKLLCCSVLVFLCAFLLFAMEMNVTLGTITHFRAVTTG